MEQDLVLSRRPVISDPPCYETVKSRAPWYNLISSLTRINDEHISKVLTEMYVGRKVKMLVLIKQDRVRQWKSVTADVKSVSYDHICANVVVHTIEGYKLSPHPDYDMEIIGPNK